MAFKFNLEDFDKKLIDKLKKSGQPQGNSLFNKLKEAAKKPRLPKL